MTPTLLETLMYDVGQLFLIPTLALIALLFLYAFWALGEFAMQAWLRARHPIGSGRGYVLVAWGRRHKVADADALDVAAHRLLERPRIATRVAPMLGLVATMIPMGPALKGLSGGNLANVGENLTIAFSAVILALIAASITFWVVNVRRRWLAEELVWPGKSRPQWEVDA
ncbi:MotA/TolQ/ExbB proton channel family protein [Cupriavidus necator]|uniref:MotA/TolQ/ExbB proton channel family protein n=1 Tax=Cupriavidus necator TaxID=106590 RepID=UPI0005B39722|nr:MotA/TolQ/ExbB proton channel family protein [Cupriavidus necator]